MKKERCEIEKSMSGSMIESENLIHCRTPLRDIKGVLLESVIQI
jgi:hypothetical protein